MSTLLSFDWLQFQSPFWLLLFIPLIAGFLWQRKTGYISKEHKTELKGRSRRNFRRALSPFLVLCSFAFFIIAIADITRGYSVLKEELTTNRIFLALDNSSSMYNFSSGPPIYCADKNLSEDFPRIYGACRAVSRLVDETEAFANKKGVHQKDEIGVIRFARHSFAQIYPTTDYGRVRAALSEMNWRQQGRALGIFTEIHEGLYDMFLMAFTRNREKNAVFTYLSRDDIDALESALSPEGKDVRFFLPHKLREKIEGLKKDMRDTVFILFTDAHQNQLESRVDKRPVSLQKMMDFARILELPVYFISIGDPNETYKDLAKKTGFGPVGGKFRGDFFVVKKEDKYAQIEVLISTILENRFGRVTTSLIERRESNASLFSLFGLLFLVAGVFSRETVDRSLTEV